MTAVDGRGTAAITAAPVTGSIGAVVGGLVLAEGIGAAAAAEVLRLLHRHKVLFFRGQDGLDDAGQVAFTRLLGEPVGHPLVDVDDRFVHPITSRYGGLADRWHTDLTFVPDFPSVSVLRAVVLPEVGGDTLWANTAAAYAGLTPELRELAGRLRAVHGNAYDYAAAARENEAEAYAWYREMAAARPFEAEHPVAAVHPHTGEPTLLLGDFAQRISGYPRDQSDLLMQLFQAQVTRAEYTVRWSWRPGDVAMWDNRATQHRAVGDFGEAARILHRTTVAGGTPVGTDGRESRRIAPDLR